MMTVFWIDPTTYAADFAQFPEGPDQISQVLECCSAMMAEGMMFVTSASNHTTMGGIVKDDKLPNGEPYTWKKRRL
jgi:hypothetical protein